MIKAPAKLTPHEVGRLGGLTASHLAGPKGMAVKGARGGNSTLRRHGKQHFVRAALKRWGRLSNDGGQP